MFRDVIAIVFLREDVDTYHASIYIILQANNSLQLLALIFLNTKNFSILYLI